MNEKARLEAFTDGVLAIAITLLTLDLKVPPHGSGRPLSQALLHEWPSYLAYLVSFLVVGIIWVNHHAMFQLVRQVDRKLLFPSPMSRSRPSTAGREVPGKARVAFSYLTVAMTTCRPPFR